VAVRNRQFLEDFMHGGKFYIKTVNDSRYVIFKGAAGSRKYIKGIRYRADNPKLKILNIITKPGEDDPAGFLSKLGGKAVDFAKESILGIALVSAEDLLQYYLTPENQRSLTDLVTSIGLDLGNYVVSKMLAGVIVGMAVAVLAPVEVAAFAAFCAVVGTIAFAAYINYKLDELEDGLGVKPFINSIASKCGEFLDGYWRELGKENPEIQGDWV